MRVSLGINPHMKSYGITIIRLGMAGVLLWFGAQQLLHSENWVGYVPEYVTSLSGLSVQTVVLANGATEIAFGLMLFLGLFTRIVAFLMGVHLALIAFSLGHTAVAVRDWGLAVALFGLLFTGGGALGFDQDN